MDLQNSTQENISSTPGGKGPGVAFGVFVGILQPIVMYFFINMIGQQMGGGSILGGLFSFSILLAFLPLILEVIFWRKKYPHFVKGATIGTVLVPLIGLGLCFVLLSGARF